MLILTRRYGQKIMIGSDIVVTILDCKNDRVNIGVDAPAAVTVHREEIALKIAKSRAAGATDPK